MDLGGADVWVSLVTTNIYTEAIAHPEVAAISVATRPDCLPVEVLDLLEELNRRKPVWVELGLQTIDAATADRIHRGYPLPVYDRAVKELRERGIEILKECCAFVAISMVI